MTELINKPYPVDGESLQSFICRIASANHYSFHLLSQYYAENDARLRSYDANDRLTISEVTQKLCGNVDTSGLIDIWSYYQKYKEQLDFARLKFCPICFAENRHAVFAMNWLKYIVSCDKHGCLCIDSCKHCGEKITVHSLSAKKCIKCATSIDSMSYESVTVDNFSRVLGANFSSANDSNQFQTMLDNIGQQVMNQLKVAVVLIGSLDFPSDKYWKRRRSLTIKELHEYQLEASKVVQDQSSLLIVLDEFLGDAYEEGYRNLTKLMMPITRHASAIGVSQIFEYIKASLLELQHKYPDFYFSHSFLEVMYKDKVVHQRLPKKGSKQSIFLKQLSQVIKS